MTGDQLDLIDGQGLAEQANRQATVAELADAIRGEHESPNTTRAYASDWRTWTAFCAIATAAGVRVDPLAGTVDPGTGQRDALDDALVVYSRWLAQGGLLPDGGRVQAHAPESIRRRLTGVLHGWRERGIDYPRGVTTSARRWVKGYEAKLIERGQPTGRGQAPALEIHDAHRIAAATEPTLAGRRDLALLFMGLALGARSSELSFLDVSDITPGERGGVWVHIRRSKTGARRPAVKPTEFDATCPVRSWQRWQAASGVITGPAFRRVDRHGNLGGRLSPDAASQIVARAGRRAGVEVRLTGHSLRAGFATAATRAKKEPHQIAAQAGWSPTSPVMHGYIRSVKVWEDNVLDGIGL